MNFKGKRVLITGGASGIGKIMGRKALERGCSHLVIWDINQEGLLQTQAEFQTLDGKISLFQVDISDLEQIKSAAEKVNTQTGGIDILINNAGIVVGKYFHEHTHEQISKSMLVNSSALMHITAEFLRGMMARNLGAVCNIASSAGLISNPKMSVYAASKWAAVGWSDSLRLEMEQLKKNISVTTIMPFYISTGMFDGVKSKLLPILEPEKTSERIIKAIENDTKMLAMPLPYWFIRFSQGILPLPAFDWVMRNVFGIYDTMKDFKGRE
ncbi:Fatty acyl-CoA reductase [Chryseobacterium taklimakanense]|uniref:Fatty acyl-CoA reductase n=1 Tax=Chryseobacterium taklimakanense TaxID=536441 RepID=A0A239WQN3_9FLAO|nr:SDR family oxidoreductase [Chryseobacterium taklimakanense]SNV36757.1 Fatty acyl-CoA reductase [Chryseobacterium taklimakanense]